MASWMDRMERMPGRPRPRRGGGGVGRACGEDGRGQPRGLAWLQHAVWPAPPQIWLAVVNAAARHRPFEPLVTGSFNGAE